MALTDCPECGKSISDKAAMCPHCGFGSRRLQAYGRGFEYKSDKIVLGLPLVHVATGWDPDTGRPRIAKGIIAVGNLACGVFAVGGLSLGVFALGGLSLGIAAFGGVALGLLLAAGGLAIGGIALGGAAIGYIAIGGAAIGKYALGGNAQDPQILELLRPYLGPRK